MPKKGCIILLLAITCNQETAVISDPYTSLYYQEPVDPCPVEVYYRIHGVEFKECYK